MVTIEKIIKAFVDEEFVRCEGLDEAIIGVDYDKMRLIYSIKKVIDILKNDPNIEDAWEHFSFEIINSMEGENSPVWCYDLFE